MCCVLGTDRHFRRAFRSFGELVGSFVNFDFFLIESLVSRSRSVKTHAIHHSYPYTLLSIVPIVNGFAAPKATTAFDFSFMIPLYIDSRTEDGTRQCKRSRSSTKRSHTERQKPVWHGNGFVTKSRGESFCFTYTSLLPIPSSPRYARAKRQAK